MEIVLTYKTTKLVKRLAEELDMFLEFEKNKQFFLIKGNTSQYNRYCRESERASREAVKVFNELKEIYSFNNFDNTTAKIFDIVATQLKNKEAVKDNSNYVEKIDGPLHPVFFPSNKYENSRIGCISYFKDVFKNYELRLMPTSSMIGMKF